MSDDDPAFRGDNEPTSCVRVQTVAHLPAVVRVDIRGNHREDALPLNAVLRQVDVVSVLHELRAVVILIKDAHLEGGGGSERRHPGVCADDGDVVGRHRLPVQGAGHDDLVLVDVEALQLEVRVALQLALDDAVAAPVPVLHGDVRHHRPQGRVLRDGGVAVTACKGSGHSG